MNTIVGGWTKKKIHLVHALRFHKLRVVFLHCGCVVFFFVSLSRPMRTREKLSKPSTNVIQVRLPGWINNLLADGKHKCRCYWTFLEILDRWTNIHVFGDLFQTRQKSLVNFSGFKTFLKWRNFSTNFKNSHFLKTQNF